MVSVFLSVPVLYMLFYVGQYLWRVGSDGGRPEGEFPGGADNAGRLSAF